MEVTRLTREFAMMFLTEAECLSHCRHPNVVRFVGGCVAPPLVCLVMELCETSLHTVIHPGSVLKTEIVEFLPPDLICTVLRGIVSGMLFLHDTMGIQHGDLKPLNVLLREGEIKLCDFGSSRLLQHGHAELACTGTLPYMAPELLLPSPPSGGATSANVAGQAVDVYSFGVCLWEMCSRQFPWRKLLEQGMVHELKRRVGREGARPPTDLGSQALPRPLLVLLEACWRQNPAERPTYRQLAALDLQNLCSSPTAEQEMVELVESTRVSAEENQDGPGGARSEQRDLKHQVSVAIPLSRTSSSPTAVPRKNHPYLNSY